MSDFWIVVQDWVLEYLVAIIMILAVIGLIIWKNWKERKKPTGPYTAPPQPSYVDNGVAQANRQQPAYPQTPAPQSPQTPVPQPPRYEIPDLPQEGDSLFTKTFIESKANKEREENLAKTIANITQRLKKEDSSLDEEYQTDIEEVKSEIYEISEKKEMIKSYGKELAILYDKYEARENQLGTMLIGLERLTNKQRREKS